MNIREALQKLEFGNPVAEYDRGLQGYFLVTQPYLALLNDNADLIAGDKGTGKTAIFQHLRRNFANEPGLADVGIVTGFNVSGEPLFRKLGGEQLLPENEYISLWKMYTLSLAGNWLLNGVKGKLPAAALKLDGLLRKLELRNEEDSAANIFSGVIQWARRLRPKIEFSADPAMPGGIVSSLEFYQQETKSETARPEDISHGQAFAVLDKALAEQKKTAWVVIDRLDEAFVGLPDIEKPALRGLFRAYLDLMEFEHVRMKLFTRKDLFRKITEDGFVNLTHINARLKEIIWDDEDLLALLVRRVRQSHEFIQLFGLVNAADQELLSLIFPRKVEPKSKFPDTWHWILAQICDGNGVKSPRNLIDLLCLAQEEQLRREQRSPRKYMSETPMLEAESLKKALGRLSQRRVEDTLIAEYGGDVRRAILAFKNGKSDYNETSLCSLFGFDAPHARLTAEILNDIGFLEQVGNIYKIPMLYRAGLNISQGKAY